jgi:hypothetical protein
MGNRPAAFHETNVAVVNGRKSEQLVEGSTLLLTSFLDAIA